MSVEIALERIRYAQENGDFILDLSNLGLKEIPDEIIHLLNLTHIYLQGNQITNIDKLAQFENLKLLNLAKNQLVEIPRFLLNLNSPILWDELSYKTPIISALNLAKDLAGELELDLEMNQAISLAYKFGLDQGHVRNLILNFEKAKMRALDRARVLSLDKKHYTTQINDKHQKMARELYLTLDLIREHILSSMQALYRPLYLIVESALYQALDLAINLDIHLFKKFNLNENIDLFILKILMRDQNAGIYLKNNPLKAPPPEIIELGDVAIEVFFDDFVEKELLNEVKVIIVGEGASGKTSLVKRLLGFSFNIDEIQTHGIKISKHKFKVKKKDLLVNFWDFGGQEIMHATHQFFLTKRCLYLLVLDSRKDEKAEYWLNYIQSFGGNAPVLVVLNKIDQNPSFDLNRQFLNKKYNNIQNYYKTSCQDNIGIDNLKSDILSYLWQLELRNTAFPKGWLKVKTHMETMAADYINYTQYQSICKEKHVHNPQSQKVLLDLLNDLGVVFNYEKLRLYDTQVLNPLWLTNAVYRIINSPILAKTNGRFHINDLEPIINDERYQKENPEHWSNIFKFWKAEQKFQRFPEEKFLFIVAMMGQFELLFKIDEFHYLIPGLLSDAENTYIFDATNSTLNFVIEYVDFLPAAIIPRLMVKLHKYIYREQIWKTGMVLEEKLLFHSIANIVLDKESRKINIEIQGKRSHDFLTVIRETLKEIHTTYQDLNIIEWIPLQELYKGEQLLVDYQELLGYEKASKEEYFSGKLGKDFSVATLLNGIEKPEMRETSKPLHIFVSYSIEDQLYKEELVKHLMPLVRLNKANLWDQSSIDAGDEWQSEINSNLEKADIVLCLISSDFVASKFCYDKELKRALEADKAGSKKVIPIKIREVNWDRLPIAELQGLPRQKWMRELGDSEAWTEVSKGIETVIDEIKKPKFRT